VPLNAGEWERLDEMRGQLPRSRYVRQVLFGRRDPPAAVEETIQAQQDEAGEAIVTTPPPVAKELLVLPRGGDWVYTERSATAGTLRIGTNELDLVGVELEGQADGSTHLRFSDRSLVRTVRGE
jgi:hypothetical protein